MIRLSNLSPGDRFGRWTVLRRVSVGRLYVCRCDCGTQRSIYPNQLTRGKTKSCGCLQREITARMRAA